MTYWRMAMKIGSQGHSLWKDCFTRGIAAIGYRYHGKPVVEDCREITEQQYDNIWRQKRPYAAGPRASLRNVAYRMKKGDTIYVKEGIWIAGKGVITKKYAYDANILAGTKGSWGHYVTVDWQRDFILFVCKLDAEQTTVLELDEERLRKIWRIESQAKDKLEATEAEEGEQYTAEVKFRARNRALIDAKKIDSDYRCEVCKMNFKEIYGELGEHYIIAHHKNPIGTRTGSSITTLDDIALVCANCHNMLHKQNPPLTITALRIRMNL